MSKIGDFPLNFRGRAHTQLYKLYANNKDFKRALADALFRLTMGDEAA